MKNVAVKLTEQAIEALGGMKRFVSRGDVVWVKPNIGWDRTPETAANTNPDVVATIIRLCFDAGAKTVKVGDNPCDVAEKTYEASGIAAAARAAGGESRVSGSDAVQGSQDRRRTSQDDPHLSGDHRDRPGDQRPDRQASPPGRA